MSAPGSGPAPAGPLATLCEAEGPAAAWAIAAALDEAGIACEVVDVPALGAALRTGGPRVATVPVRVPAARLEDARAVLEDLPAVPDEPGDDASGPARPRPAVPLPVRVAAGAVLLVLLVMLVAFVAALVGP